MFQGYRILYLVPKAYESLLSNVQKIQLKYFKSLLEERLLPSLINPKELEKFKNELHDFEKIMGGFVNLDMYRKMPAEVLGKIGDIWYVFSRFFTVSFGPRVGDFAEEILEYFIKTKRPSSRVYRKVNIYKHPLLKHKEKTRRRKEIDFIIQDKDSLTLIELRLSEHTGGKTAQQSLFDKHKIVLDWILSDELDLKSKGFSRLDLIIAILYTEKDHKIIYYRFIKGQIETNINESRLRSLIDYMLETDHIGGRIQKLISEKGFVISYDGGVSFRKNYNRENAYNALLKHKSLILQNSRINFTISIKILLGEEFFREIVRMDYKDFLNAVMNQVGDDPWLFFSVALNEYKIYAEFERTNVSLITSLVKTILNQNDRLLSEFKSFCNGLINFSNSDNIFEFIYTFIRKLKSEVTDYCKRKGIKLRLLETNDLAKQDHYLTQLLYISLSIIKFQRVFD